MDLGDELRTKENSLGQYDGTDGRWGASDYAFALSFSHELNRTLAIGGNLKYIKQEIDAYSADAFAIDLGVQTKFINDDITFGASIQNLGTRLKFIEAKTNLPIIYRVGGAYTIVDNFLITGDLVKPNDNDLTFRLGVEYSFNKLLALRAGWNSSDDLSSTGLSAGLGVKYQKISLDYSFEPKKYFGDVHRFSINYSF